MPLFRFSEESLDLDFALAQRFLVGRGQLVDLHAFQILLAEGAPDGAARLPTGGAVGSKGTGTARRRSFSVEGALTSMSRETAGSGAKQRGFLPITGRLLLPG